MDLKAAAVEHQPIMVAAVMAVMVTAKYTGLNR
jgi:hypothetical protein